MQKYFCGKTRSNAADLQMSAATYNITFSYYFNRGVILSLFSPFFLSHVENMVRCVIKGNAVMLQWFQNGNEDTAGDEIALIQIWKKTALISIIYADYKGRQKEQGKSTNAGSRSSIQALQLQRQKLQYCTQINNVVLLYVTCYISNLDNEKSFSALVSFGKKTFSPTQAKGPKI